MMGPKIILFPCKLKFDRPFGLLCKKGSNNMLSFHIPLVAEISADIRGEDPDLVDFDI